MYTKAKRVRFKGITKNPLVEKLKAKKDESFGRFRSKFSEKIVY